jgi:predicted small integral membrane protein
MRARPARKALILPLAALAGPAAAQQTQGWGQLKTEAEPEFSWTMPLFNGFWMAWTPATIAFFALVFALIALMGVLEWRRPGGAERHGVLGLVTTRGDRLFISLLGTAYILLLWLFFFGEPIWGAVGIAALWFAFVFWKV